MNHKTSSTSGRDRVYNCWPWVGLHYVNTVVVSISMDKKRSLTFILSLLSSQMERLSTSNIPEETKEELLAQTRPVFEKLDAEIREFYKEETE